MLKYIICQNTIEYFVNFLITKNVKKSIKSSSVWVISMMGNRGKDFTHMMDNV